MLIQEKWFIRFFHSWKYFKKDECELRHGTKVFDSNISTLTDTQKLLKNKI